MVNSGTHRMPWNFWISVRKWGLVTTWTGNLAMVKPFSVYYIKLSLLLLICSNVVIKIPDLICNRLTLGQDNCVFDLAHRYWESSLCIIASVIKGVVSFKAVASAEQLWLMSWTLMLFMTLLF